MINITSKIFKTKVYWPILEFKNSIKNFLNPNFPRWRKTLPKRSDISANFLFVNSNFNIVLDFYYEQVVPNKNSYQERNKNFYDQLVTNVDWIENKKTKFEKQLDEILKKASGESTKDKIDFNESYDKIYTQYEIVKKNFESQETKVLTWLIDNRNLFTS